VHGGGHVHAVDREVSVAGRQTTAVEPDMIRDLTLRLVIESDHSSQGTPASLGRTGNGRLHDELWEGKVQGLDCATSKTVDRKPSRWYP
jgi:hypothetical protein